MPTVLQLFGLVFRIYTRDHLPPHVHVISPDGEAKFTIGETVVELVQNKGMKQKDINLSLSILEENRERLINEWNKIHQI